MRVKLVTLRFAPSLGGFDDRPLADFIRDKEVLAVREHFFVVHDLPHVACLVTYQEEAFAAATPTNGSHHAAEPARPHPAQDLDDAGRVLYGTLREWRSETARKDGVPPYVVLTNRQMTAIVQARPATPNALLSIAGFGPGKVERYGAAILAKMNGHAPAAPTPLAAPSAPAACGVAAALVAEPSS